MTLGGGRRLPPGETLSKALRRALNLEESAMTAHRLVLAVDRTSRFPARWKGDIASV